MNNDKASQICKALGDPNRLQIIQLLTTGEKCACKLLEAFNITQPTLSHHMKILCDCNLVAFRKEGKWTYYSLNCTAFNGFKNFISSITCGQKETLCNQKETAGWQGEISGGKDEISDGKNTSSLVQSETAGKQNKTAGGQNKTSGEKNETSGKQTQNSDCGCCKTGVNK